MKTIGQKLFSILLAGTLVSVQDHVSAQEKRYHSEELIPVVDLGPYQAIGVSVSSQNRLFVSFPRRSGPYRYGLTEVVDGQLAPFPDKEWNTADAASKNGFASVQDLFVDAQDHLWVLDSKPSGGNGEGQFKLLNIDLKSNRIEKIYHFEDLDKVRSALNDVRVDTERALAYLSDPGLAAIVVLDLKTGKTRALLANTPYTLADPDIVLSYQGNEMRDENGKPFSSHINGIALSKDLTRFYFKPINQTWLFSIETAYLADTTLNEATLASKVEQVVEVGVTHGLEADAKGNIFLTNSLDYAVRYLSRDGTVHTLVQDDRLLWPDSFGIGADGYLYFSCAQLQMEATWNQGENKTQLPYTIYKVKLP